MKNSVDKTKAAVLQRLHMIRAQRRELDREENAIKTQVKPWLVETNALCAGGFLLKKTEVQTTRFNKKKLEAEHGREFVAQYEETSSYNKLEISES